jgi:methionyl-tRNA formyltransferase
MFTPRIAFFGTPDIAVSVLDVLSAHHMLPSVIITNPDAPQGRKMMLTPPPVKAWADKQNIPVLQPVSLRTDTSVADYLTAHAINLCIVVAYGKIIPKNILDTPKYGTLNVHPSLLPKLRGASPIRSAILEDMRETGVTVMLLDEELDHGPILAQEVVSIGKEAWPLRGQALDTLLAEKGGELLAKTIPEWVAGDIIPTPQDDSEATFCTKITKEMGEINLTADPYQNLLKIRAFDGWPGTFFFTERNGRRIRASYPKEKTKWRTQISPVDILAQKIRLKRIQIREAQEKVYMFFLNVLVPEAQHVLECLPPAAEEALSSSVRTFELTFELIAHFVNCFFYLFFGSLGSKWLPADK